MTLLTNCTASRNLHVVIQSLPYYPHYSHIFAVDNLPKRSVLLGILFSNHARLRKPETLLVVVEAPKIGFTRSFSPAPPGCAGMSLGSDVR